MYPIHRRHSQATTVSDDSFTQTTSDLVHLHYPLPYPNPYPLHGHIERDSLSYSAVRDDVTSHTTSDLNHCIKMLQSRIDAQQEVIAAQKSAIYEQSESIRTLELNIEYWTNLK